MQKYKLDSKNYSFFILQSIVAASSSAVSSYSCIEIPKSEDISLITINSYAMHGHSYIQNYPGNEDS
jgi:hypothetical protein